MNPLASIIVGFSRPHKNTIISWAIERAEGTEYDHVYVRLYSKSLNRWLVYQASGLAVNFMGWERFKQKNRIVEEYAIEATDEERTKVLQFSVDEAGAPYGSKWLIGMAYMRLMWLWFHKKAHNPYPSGKLTFGCSKLGGYVLKLLGKGYSQSQLEDADPKWINQQIKSWSRAVRLLGG